MNLNKQYIFVNIRTPLEVRPDGSYQIIAERVIVDIGSCNELPPINTSENDKKLLLQIQSHFSSITSTFSADSEETSSTVFVEDEIKNDDIKNDETKNDEIKKDPIFVFNTEDPSRPKTKSRQNITFRNKLNNSDKSLVRHYTRKNYNYQKEEESEDEPGSYSESESETDQVNSNKTDVDSVQ